MSAEHDAKIRAALRPAAEELISADDAKWIALVRRVLTETGVIRPGAIPILPPNAHNTVNDESVVVAFPDYSAAIDLETLLGEMLAHDAAPPLAVQEADGDPTGSINTLIVPNGALSFDDDTDTAILELLAWVTATLVEGSNITITPVGDTLVIASTGGGSAIVVQEGDSTVVSVVDTLDFDASDFNVTETPSGEANISLAYGTSAGTPAEGNHTHSALVLKVQEGDADVDTAVTSIDFDASDFNVTSSPSGEANISLAYGTSAGTPSEGNHTHSAVTITVEEGDSTVDATVTNLDFDASDFNVTSSPAGEANIALAYGTSAGTPAEGNHTHAAGGAVITVQEGDTNVDTAVTTLDFNASDFNVTSSPAGEANISLVVGTGGGVIFGGWVTQRYYTLASLAASEDGSLGGSALTADTMHASLFCVPSAASFDQVAINVSSLIALSTIRLGVYTVGTDGKPGALIADWGTVSSASTGDKTLSISWAPNAGWYYLVQVSTHAPGTLRISAGLRVAPFGNGSLTLIGVTDWTKASAGSSAALPDPFGSTPTSTGTHRPVWLRVT